MKCPKLPHPADMCEESCSPIQPKGFNATAKYVSVVPVSEIIGSPSNNKIRTVGEARATSLISQEDANQKALELAMAQAAENMRLYLTAYFPPTGHSIV